MHSSFVLDLSYNGTISCGVVKGRMDLLGLVLFSMLFLQFGIRDYQPAAVLIPPYMVIALTQMACKESHASLHTIV